MQEPERRVSYRCRTPSDDEAAILRTRNRDLPVLVCEKSSGGFGVISRRPVKLAQGAILSLATRGGCCEVEVMHVQQLDDRTTRIGLKARRELKALQCPLFSLFTVRRLFACGAGLLKLAAVVALCTGMFVWGSTLPLADLAEAANRLVGQTRQTARDPAGPPPREANAADEYPPPDRMPDPRRPTGLNLSPRQQARIRAVLDETAVSLSSGCERQSGTANPAPWPDRGMQTIYDSWRRIEQVLTEEQRQRWNALLEQAEEPEQPRDG